MVSQKEREDATFSRTSHRQSGRAQGGDAERRSVSHAGQSVGCSSRLGGGVSVCPSITRLRLITITTSSSPTHSLPCPPPQAAAQVTLVVAPRLKPSVQSLQN